MGGASEEGEVHGGRVAEGQQAASCVDIPKLESAKFSNLDSVESNEHIIPGYRLSFTHSAAAIGVSLLFLWSWYVHSFVNLHDDIALERRPLRCLLIPKKQRPHAHHGPSSSSSFITAAAPPHRLLARFNPTPKVRPIPETSLPNTLLNPQTHAHCLQLHSVDNIS